MVARQAVMTHLRGNAMQGPKTHGAVGELVLKNKVPRLVVKTKRTELALW